MLAPLKEKTIVNFGDSIFGLARPPEDISTRLAELTGATVHNCGFGGALMSAVNNTYHDFCMVELANAITSKDFSKQDTAIAENGSLPAYYADTLALLKTIDFDKVDIVTIAYGTNDHHYVELDNSANPLDTTKIMGALRYSIEAILTAYPHIKIFICSQTYRFWMDENGAFTNDTDTLKSNNKEHTYTELLEATETVAKEYKLPYIDNYYALGINKFNRGQYFPENDGTHHNLNGRILLADHIAKYLF
jgi:lysophospholipase L1-like esterase